MKTNKSKYASISNLKEIEYEKQFLRYKIERKEKIMEREWDEIHNTWGFVSTIANTISSVAQYIPVGVSVVSQITGFFRGRSKKKQIKCK